MYWMTTNDYIQSAQVFCKISKRTVVLKYLTIPIKQFGDQVGNETGKMTLKCKFKKRN